MDAAEVVEVVIPLQAINQRNHQMRSARSNPLMRSGPMMDMRSSNGKQHLADGKEGGAQAEVAVVRAVEVAAAVAAEEG